MDTKPILRGEEPSQTRPRLPPQSSSRVPLLASDTESRTSKKRKAEQACDLCRKKKAKCQGSTPSCVSCRDGNAEYKYNNVPRQRNGCQKNGQTQQHRRGSLDRMAERISRMEMMLRQRGFLQDNPTGSLQQIEFKETDCEYISEETGKDSVPSLCETGLDSTIQTGLTVTGSNMEPPPLPDKERVLGKVEMWLKGVPPFVNVEMDFGKGHEPMGDNGY